MDDPLLDDRYWHGHDSLCNINFVFVKKIRDNSFYPSVIFFPLKAIIVRVLLTWKMNCANDNDDAEVIFFLF